jgi:Gpi18-like mannosyltransferase
MNTSKQASSTENTSETPAFLTQATAIPTSTDTLPQPPTTVPPERLWASWYLAFKNILPVYIATHIAFLVLTYLATLFIVGNFSPQSLGVATLPHSWYRWDSGHFTHIATYGYDAAWRTAFFPLFSLLESIPMLFMHHPHPLLAGLIVANLADLGTLIVLYRLVQQDFDQEQAYRTILYLSVFPTAFFLVAAYNESLFLCLTLLSFYHMRQRQWWLAGLFGFLASLTRSAGVILFVPFCYEYLRQHDFKLKALRLDSISGLCIPAGLALFAFYCYIRFHDFLAFSHAQSVWKRELQFPWEGLNNAWTVISQGHTLSFDSIHNVIDASAMVVMLLLVAFCFVGPWRFSRSQWSYAIYAASLYLFLLLFPSAGTFPLQSLSRLVLEVFPAFLILAAMGKSRQFNLYYLTLSVALLSFMLLQFLTGRWIV